jgi:hypothetical protein
LYRAQQWPSFYTLAALEVSRKVANYALVKPAREVK